MAFIRGNYVFRKPVGTGRRSNTHNSVWDCRDWWLGVERIYIGYVSIPKELRGKRLRFRIEVKESENTQKKARLLEGEE